ncbi:MAG: S9 family peptidase [Actinomycetota bacterium]|nr:S9 family peptidase [Actinomycetota bacterium]
MTEKAAHPLSPEQLTDQRRPSDVRVSPDGRWAVFVVRPFAKEAEHPVSDLWILPLPEGVPRRFTSGDWLDEAPRPSPDGFRLAFLSDRAERGEKSLYVIPIDGGEALRIFDEQGDVSEPSWSPDGRFIAVLFTEPESRVEKERKKRREDAKVWDTDYRYRRLWVVDAESLEARPVSPEDRQVWGYAWSPDGEWLAINTTATPKVDDKFKETEVSIVPRKGGTSRMVFRTEGQAEDLVWSPDGAYLAYRSRAGRVPYGEYVYRRPLEGGEVACLTPDYEGTGEYLGSLADGELLFLAHEGVVSALYRLGWDGKLSRLRIGGKASGTLGYFVSASGDGNRLAMIWQDGTHAPEVYVAEVNEAGQGPVRRTWLGVELEEAALGEVEVVWWESDPGVEVQGLLVKPHDYRKGERYPLVVQVHGGPTSLWAEKFCASWRDWAQVLAGRGYAVLLPNPRGSTGRGSAFSNAIFGDAGGGELRDVISGVDAMIEHGLADPERLGIGGWSWGGYLTALAVTRTDRFKAAVIGAGVSNLISDNSLGDIPSANLSYFRDSVYHDPDPYYERSPIRYVSNARTPTLILHGEEDKRVAVAQSVEMYIALRTLKVETQLVTYPREGHSIEEREHQLDLVRRVLNWFERHLQPGSNSNSSGTTRPT